MADNIPLPSGDYTDSIGSGWAIFDGPGETPKNKKIDPSTIQRPEGVPKPWEQSTDKPEEPPEEK